MCITWGISETMHFDLWTNSYVEKMVCWLHHFCWTGGSTLSFFSIPLQTMGGRIHQEFEMKEKKFRSKQGLSKHISQIVLAWHKTNTEIFVKNLLTNIVIINLQMLSMRMKYKIDRKCNCRNVVASNNRNIREENFELLEQNVKLGKFCSRSS